VQKPRTGDQTRSHPVRRAVAVPITKRDLPRRVANSDIARSDALARS